MSSKKDVLNILELSRGQYISGEAIAKKLGLSRNSIWKAIKSLKEQGYSIESKTNKGYRLKESNDILSAASLTPWLSNPQTAHKIEFYKAVDSTNTLGKERALAGAPDGTVILAETQTAGRGRMGRSFYSPDGSGIYLSIILRPNAAIDASLLITITASVLISRAIHKITGFWPEIKWVNDLFYNGKKICGILTEASADFETGTIDYIVLGAGINFTAPEEDIPDALKPIIGTLFEKSPAGNLRSRLAAEIINELSTLNTLNDKQSILKEYRSHSMVIGQSVILTSGQTTLAGTVLDINEHGHLILKTLDGTIHTISSGEVSLRLNKI
ncbi:MAG: biotin--[acetyl-CoA-carboxylase] ligase [Eubacterium sp.]